MSAHLMRRLAKTLATSTRRTPSVCCSIQGTRHLQKTLHRCLNIATNSYLKKSHNVYSPRQAVRYSHASAEASFAFDLKADHAVIKRGETTYHCSYLWLRDHCQSPKCYDVNTNQRLTETNKIDPAIVPESLDCNEEGIQIIWPDKHKTFYSWDWMQENGPGQKLPTNITTRPLVYWNAETVDKVLPPDVRFDDLISNDDALKTLVETIYTYGIAFVNEVPTTEDDTRRAIERIGAVWETFYGKMWTFSANLAKADTAFTNKELGTHTDNSYFYEPAGLQVLHCLCHDGDGGENPMVDGFHAAESLRSKSPDLFEALCRIPLTGRYLGDGQNLNVPYHTLRINPITQQLDHIRFNVYDRGPLSHLSQEDIKIYYDAFRALAAEIQDPSNIYEVIPTPGRMMIFDNWRVLHGRKGFTGKRIMTGCYVSRMEYLNALRTIAGI